MNTTIESLNRQIVDEAIEYLVMATDGRCERSDVIRMVATITECTGGLLDACSHCGAMPMTTNCNNARCQDLL